MNKVECNEHTCASYRLVEAQCARDFVMFWNKNSWYYCLLAACIRKKSKKNSKKKSTMKSKKLSKTSSKQECKKDSKKKTEKESSKKSDTKAASQQSKKGTGGKKGKK
jgi:hypothetical protein